MSWSWVFVAVALSVGGTRGQPLYRPPASYFLPGAVKPVVGTVGDHVAIQFWAPTTYPWERFTAECTFTPRKPGAPVVVFTVLRREDGWPIFEGSPFGERGTLIYPLGTPSRFMTFGIEPAKTSDSGTYTCVTQSGGVKSPSMTRKLRVRRKARRRASPPRSNSTR